MKKEDRETLSLRINKDLKGQIGKIPKGERSRFVEGIFYEYINLKTTNQMLFDLLKMENDLFSKFLDKFPTKKVK